MIDNLALQASAGSGKTYALSVRYISLLFIGATPEQILTLTFTNKAALEMKKRIYEALKNLENKDELESICEITQKSREAILAKKDKVLQSFLQSDLKISTIDSFFSSILRKFSFNIGLMPDFSLEEDVINDEKIERFLKICKKDMLYKSLVLLALNEKKKLSDIFNLFKLLYEKHSEINFDSFIQQSSYYPSEKRIMELISDIKERFAKNGLGEKTLKTLDISSVKELLEKKFLARDDFDYWHYKKYTDDFINALHVELKNELYNFIKAKEAYIFNEIAKLYKAFEDALNAESKKSSTLSFSQMTNKLYEILTKDISKDFLYFRIDGSFNHILIDEFQDTNIVQYKILEPFLEEIASGVGVKKDRSLFLVGDTKQSIYRFRGGAKELFDYAQKRLNLKEEVLDTNYRSSSSVVNFINSTYKDIIQGYVKQKVKKDAIEGFVCVSISENIEKELIDSLEKLLQNGASQSDIAILCHTNQEALMLKELIEEEIEYAKVTMEAKRKLINIPMISAIIDFIHYLYFEDEIYLENFKAITEKTYVKDEYSFDISKSVDGMIIEIIRYFDIFSLEADMLLFIESCSKYIDIEDFLFNYQDLNTSSISKESEGIRVLTIHKSKGLEFSNVFVMDRLKRARSGGETFIYEYDEIQLKNIFLKVKNREFFDIGYARAKEKESEKTAEDLVNTQYVAMTRAKDNLFVLAKEKNSAFANLNLCDYEAGNIYIKMKSEKKELNEIAFFTPKKLGIQNIDKIETDKIETNDFKSIDFGLALHYMLEILGEFEENFVENAYESLRNRYKSILDEDDLKDIKKRVIKLIHNKEFKNIIKDGHLLREQPIYYNGQRKQLDLLIEFEDEVVVVDYKSSEFLQSSHVKQVSLYKNAIKEIYGKECSAYLCYLKNEKNEIVKI